MKRAIFLAGGLVFGCAAVALTVMFAMKPADAFSQCREDDMVDVAKIGASFELIDETGATVTDKDVFSRPTLFYMGYTFCPDVCPMDNMRNAEAVYLLEERGVDVQAVFASVDPERDTPEVLTEFTDAFHPGMIGLTGTPEALMKLSQDYGSFFEIKKEGDDEFYLVDHTTYSFVILPDHGVVDVIKRDVSPEKLAERTSCLIERA